MSGLTPWYVPAWTTRSDSPIVAGARRARLSHAVPVSCGPETGKPERPKGQRSAGESGLRETQSSSAAYCSEQLQLLPAEFPNHIPGQGNRMILTGELVSRYPFRGGELVFPVCIEVHGRIAIDLRGKT